MLTLDIVKQHLRIDGDSEDSYIADTLMTYAAGYCRSAIDDFDTRYAASKDFARLADELQLIIIAERYDDRSNFEWKPDNSATILIGQLQYTTLGEAVTDDEQG